MSKAIAEIAIGAGLIALDIFAPVLGITLTAAWAATLAATGASLVIGGIGTLLTKQQVGLGANVRNPISPWNVVYGRAKIGGTVVYIEETGESDKYLHLVYVLACHSCQSLDAVLFDGKRICLDTSGNSLSFGGSASQQTVNIASISRADNVVTVVMTGAMPLPASSAAGPALLDGDTVQIQNVTTDMTLNGQYQIQILNSTTFTYICGGNPVSITGQGQVKTQWPDYGDTVHLEVALGNQSYSSPPFPGLLASGDTGSQGLWTANHLLLGRTAVYLRLKYGGNTYASGLPTIAFLLSGKNDIYDPRGTASSAVLAAPSITTWTMISGVATQQATGSSTYSYVVVAIDGSSNVIAVSPAGSTTSADSVLSGSNFNAIVWTPVPGAAIYKIYRTAGYVTGKIAASGDGHLPVGQIWFNDTGFVGDGTSPPSASNFNGYTENAALCIADFLTQPVWGFKCNYGTDVPTAQLISAANICDEAVPLAIGTTEPRYTSNGSFQLSAKRGEILQNLLTSCSGRLTYSGGQFVIWPAAWQGASLVIGGKPISSVTFYAITSHVPSVTAAAEAEIFVSDGTHPQAWGESNPLDFGYRVQDTTSWTLRTDTLATFTGIASEDLLNTVVSFRQHGGIGATTPDQFLIYDCYADVTYTDLTTATFRPSQWGIASNGFTNGSSTIANPQNSYDGSTSDCATINYPSWGIFAQYSNELQLTSFLPPGSSGAPDTDLADSSLALAHMAGPFQWKPKLAVRDLYNGVKGTYVSPLNSWQASDFPPYAQDVDHGYSSDANLAADGGDRRWYDIQLPFTISVATAQRLAKIELLRRRYQGAGTFVFDLAMYQVATLDIVAFTFPLLGWSNKLLEVSAHRFTVSKQSTEGSESMVLGTELDLQETDPSVYEWSTSEELSPEGYQQASLTGTQSISAPTGVTATNSTVSGTGVTEGQIQVTWTAPTDGWVTNGGQVIVQYSTDDTNWVALGTFDPSTTTAYVPNVAAGTTYWVRVAFINTAGAQSGWTAYGPITATGSSLTFSFADNETPSGALNGSNQTFTLAHTPNPASSLQFSLNGDLQLSSVDYTLSGSTITLLIATPNTSQGDWIRASYRY